jgi:hypothetical protein
VAALRGLRGRLELFNKIQDILNSDLTSSDKQISIEKSLVEYDVIFFKEHLDIRSNQIKILNLEYVKILENLNRFIKFYLVNKYANLIKLFNSEKDNKYALIILMILYLGNDRTISFVYKEMLKIIFLKEEMTKTNLIFILANKFIKIFNLIKPEKVSLIAFVASKRLSMRLAYLDCVKARAQGSKVDKLCSFENLKFLIKDMDLINKLSLGDTLV